MAVADEKTSPRELIGWCPDCNQMVPFPHHGQERPRWFTSPRPFFGDTAELRRAYDRAMSEPGLDLDEWFGDPTVGAPAGSPLTIGAEQTGRTIRTDGWSVPKDDDE